MISVAFMEYDNPLIRERFSQYNCYKYKICTRGPPKVCAIDSSTGEMDVFEDKCTVYNTNCKKKTFFKIINMSHCDSMKHWMETHNDSLQFQHLNRTYVLKFSTTTVAPETTTFWSFVPSLVKLVMDQFL
ncbi:hypothetical protein evm_001956 [Chilo suppressalis]|nr:hypothetical protein evm_001956 [Chilo suppressalis]